MAPPALNDLTALRGRRVRMCPLTTQVDGEERAAQDEGREISSRLPSPTAPSTNYVPFRRWRRTRMISKNLGQWLRSGHYSRKGF
jgi:hypothetical protein